MITRLIEIRQKKADPNYSCIVVDVVRGPQLRNPCNCLPKT